MDFWNRLEEVRGRWNVLEHPFYQRWSQGELTQEELAWYAGQYHHAVVALADASQETVERAPLELRESLERHAAEERSHVELWGQFTGAVGGSAEDSPTAETTACAEQWVGSSERPFLQRLVTMYAVESGQPAISETKREGLVAHYGFAAGPATAYFDLHSELDKEHAAAERALIEPRLADADHDGLLSAAEAALRANWELLDGVERLGGREIATAA